MGLFAPWFLAALAGVTLPLYLHLLKKLKSTAKPVPSLMFFEARTQASTRHRRLRYLLLLSLRLLWLVLLILAFANPFINRNASALDRENDGELRYPVKGLGRYDQHWAAGFAVSQPGIEADEPDFAALHLDKLSAR